MLKLPLVVLVDMGCVKSQTFPEGKGVETSLIPRADTLAIVPGRRPSQKVKVLKLSLTQTTRS